MVSPRGSELAGLPACCSDKGPDAIACAGDQGLSQFETRNKASASTNVVVGSE